MTQVTVTDKRDEAVTVIIRAMADFVNGGDSKQLADVMLNDLVRQHRTLQQGVMSALKCLIEQYAALDPMWVDPRNQDAHEWAKRVAAICDSPSRTLPGRLPFL